MPVAECSLSALLESPLMKPFLGTANKDVVPLGKVPGPVLKKLNAELVSAGQLKLPLNWSEFSPTLSFCGMPGGAEAASCVCIHSWERGIYVDWAYARPNASKTLMAVLGAVLTASVEEYGPDGSCSAVLASDAGASLMKKLAGDAVKFTTTLRYEMQV